VPFEAIGMNIQELES